MKPILIVDDDSRNIFALEATLRSRGFACVSAQDANQALSFAMQCEPSLVLMDMMMPDLDGYDAIPKIKATIPDVAVIAVTAQAMSGDRERCLQAGADEYVAKPIDVDKLMQIIYKFTNTNGG